jgi:hypothetical protein
MGEVEYLLATALKSAMFKLMMLALLGLAAADVPQGTYPSLTDEQIAEEFPKIANEYIVVFKNTATEGMLSAHLDHVKTLGTVHRDYHIKADDTTKSFRGYHGEIFTSTPFLSTTSTPYHPCDRSHPHR